MTRRLSWDDAERALRWLESRPGSRRTLLLLARLPLLPERTIERLAGLRGGRSVYRMLQQLRGAGLVAGVRPPFRPGHAPQLLYLTDLGLAVVALDQQVEPEPLARRNGLRRRDLLALLPGLPRLVAIYELLAAVASSRPGHPNLLAWERPWRRRYQRPTAKAAVTVQVPAYAALEWDGTSAAYLLLPDLGDLPLRIYRPTLDHLLVLRATVGHGFPWIVIATTGSRRAQGWQALLEEVRSVRREAPLGAWVTTWSDMSSGLYGLVDVPGHSLQPAHDLVRQVRVPRLRLRRGAVALPRLVAPGLQVSPGVSAMQDDGSILLQLTPADRRLLDTVGRHPFLPADSLATVLGWDRTTTGRRWERLVHWGLLRTVEAHEKESTRLSDDNSAHDLVELTAAGLTVAAGQLGLSVAVAVRWIGLVGGGPQAPVGARRKLLKNLAHTLGADAMFVRLSATAQRLAKAGGDDLLVEWQSERMCTRRHVRPDGYGVYRHASQLYGFFLEYDRGTMGVIDYLEKFAAYHKYLVSGRYQEDYEGFPTILIVTRDHAAEERIARAALMAATGRGGPLPLLLTCEWRITDGRNPHGLLGPIWREPDAAFSVRRHWPIVPARGALARPAAASTLQVNGGTYAGTKR
ncbi:MAG: replication-relaxation family protein [Chloroflexi bacterium]|nr:replication-relaxation family protein [Chloroflexota bacterium]